MQFTLEAVARNQELILGLTQAWVLEMQGAFLPITLKGDQSPDVGEEGHLSDEELWAEVRSWMTRSQILVAWTSH